MTVLSSSLPRAARASVAPFARPVADQARLRRLSQGMRARRMFALLAETFRALGDTTRVELIWCLSQGELCVGDLAELLGMSQPAVSHHLRTLRNLKLVRVRKAGRVSYYALDDEHIERLLNEGIRHVEDLL
jgi:ArsR family transcriptional regulator, lead/cadmium/zinc/bismuth-responsive transcriptional repressor